MYKFVFRIRQRYFDQIVAGTKTVEYRKDIYFWQLRINNIFSALGLKMMTYPVANNNIVFDVPLTKDDNVQAVFICGKRKHLREATGIARIITPDYFSEQGKKDVDTPRCFAFLLGEAIP